MMTNGDIGGRDRRHAHHQLLSSDKDQSNRLATNSVETADELTQTDGSSDDLIDKIRAFVGRLTKCEISEHKLKTAVLYALLANNGHSTDQTVRKLREARAAIGECVVAPIARTRKRNSPSLANSQANCAERTPAKMLHTVCGAVGRQSSTRTDTNGDRQACEPLVASQSPEIVRSIDESMAAYSPIDEESETTFVNPESKCETIASMNASATQTTIDSKSKADHKISNIENKDNSFFGEISTQSRNSSNQINASIMNGKTINSKTPLTSSKASTSSETGLHLRVTRSRPPPSRTPINFAERIKLDNDADISREDFSDESILSVNSKLCAKIITSEAALAALSAMATEKPSLFSDSTPNRAATQTQSDEISSISLNKTELETNDSDLMVNSSTTPDSAPSTSSTLPLNHKSLPNIPNIANTDNIKSDLTKNLSLDNQSRVSVDRTRIARNTIINLKPKSVFEIITID